MNSGSSGLKENNGEAVQVQVANPYHLVVSAQDPNSGAIQNFTSAGGTMSALPSRLGTGHVQQPIPMQIGCVDDSGNSAPTGSCFFALNLAPGSDNGGHFHTSGRPLILDGSEGGLDMPAGGNATNGPLSVDTYGGSLSYAPSDIAGDVVLNVTGSDAQGNPLGSAIPITFSVGVPNLQEMLPGDAWPQRQQPAARRDL